VMQNEEEEEEEEEGDPIWKMIKSNIEFLLSAKTREKHKENLTTNAKLPFSSDLSEKTSEEE